MSKVGGSKPKPCSVTAGETFGQLEVVEVYREKGLWWAKILCSCGVKKVVRVARLIMADNPCRSCGCRARISHGGSKTLTYNSWESMKSRCLNSNNIRFDRYGGRGITICSQWVDSFETFLADMGPRPSSQHTFDRWPNKDGNYEPGNCRWATKKEQSDNRSTVIMLTYSGKTQTINDWHKELGISANCIKLRLDRGFSVEDALRGTH